MQPFPSTESTFIIPGVVGNIEILTTPANDQTTSCATAIICHPHPLHAGTMKNKVVTTLARVFRDLNLRTVRFNFRGVGKSAGTHDEGKGEVDDVLAIAEWIKTHFPEDELWLSGFSFGAYVATIAATKIKTAQLVTISPQVSRFKHDDLTQLACPWVLVQGEQDEVIPPADVFEWIDTLLHKPQLIRMPTAGHFFHGQLLELRKNLEEWLVRR